MCYKREQVEIIQMLSYPPVKAETGKRMFDFQGANVFNKQPKYIREENLYCVLKTEIDLYDGL